jgi:hypothetical protein
MTRETGPTAESQHHVLIHPLTGNRFEYDAATTPAERMRLISDPEALSEYNLHIFSRMFPDALEARDFDNSSVIHVDETHPSDEQKTEWRILLRGFGFMSARKKDTFGTEDVPYLRVAFADDNGTITWWLNRLPAVSRLKSVSQTEQGFLPFSSMVHHDLRQNISRNDHTKHMAFEVMQTYFRLALMQPEMFIERVYTDFERYARQASPGEPELASMVRAWDRGDTAGERALSIAREYGQYVVTAAYLHDVATPGLGDLIMNVRHPDTPERRFSYGEDRVLEQSIGWMAERDFTGLPQLLTHFSMDRRLLVTMVRSLASEGDTCLPGYLFKDKRKYPAEYEGIVPFTFGEAAYDEDQGSGTTTNAQYLAEELFPGGHKHLRLGETRPVGSFDERTRLLAYMLASGMTKRQLSVCLHALGIDETRVFLSHEEYSVSHNVALLDVAPAGNAAGTKGEIMPVPLLPGDVKKALTLYNVLRIWYYRSPRRAAYEAFLQSVFAELMYGEYGQHKLSERFFTNRTDTDILTELQNRIPVVVDMVQDLLPYATILSARELEQAEKTGEHTVLARPADMRTVVDRKSGTLVVTGEGDVRPYEEVLKYRMDRQTGHRVPNPHSLPDRLDSVTAALSSMDLYFALCIPSALSEKLQTLLDRTPEYRTPLRKAVSLWLPKQDADGGHVQS